DFFGMQRSVALLISEDVSSPATAGFLHPVVLLPAEAEGWSESRLDMVFRHELAHIRRGDWLASLVARLACVLYAPDPLVWLANAWQRSESEAACDDVVVATGVDPKRYAHELLSIAKNVRTGSFRLEAATVGIAHRPKVEGRLRAIVDSRRRRGSVSRR